MKKIALVCFLAAFCFSLCGCLFIFGGAVGAAGVYVVGKDAVQIDSDKSSESAWTAAMAVARIRGTVKEDDVSNGVIKAQVEGNFIWITITRLSPNTCRIKVAARKHHFPNITMAQEILLKIIEEMK
ncbi:MAG: DUF3568 family protein [Candidatus Omnitrophica bacterium]|nr:DUF3568 family protein [Candidatus Omnitrophota bacterium]